MNHTDHVNLIRDGVADVKGTWAELGSGTGAFTLALAELLDGKGRIYSIDRNADALEKQRKAMRAKFPNQAISYHTADFTRKLGLPLGLDGVLMANSLHFVRNKAPVLKFVHDYLIFGGRLLLVEYNTDQGDTWVPYPFSYETWAEMAKKNGFRDTRKLATRPSRFLGEIFSALSVKD